MNKSQAEKIIKVCGGYKAVAPSLKSKSGLNLVFTQLHRDVANDMLSDENKRILKGLLYKRITELEQLALEIGEQYAK